MRRFGYTWKILKALSEYCCMTYEEISKTAQMPRSLVKHYAMLLEKRGIAKRIYTGKGLVVELCLNICVEDKKE